MTPRPALVDPHGGPMTGNKGGPMPLAKPAATWSHVAGKRQALRATGSAVSQERHFPDAPRLARKTHLCDA